MKYRFFILPVLLCFLFVNTGKISALNTGYSTVPLSPSEEDNFRSKIEISFLQDEPKKRPIVCFDVNESEQIALGSENFSTKYICVYTADGNFQYGYSFDWDGSFSLEWDANTINIYLVRGAVIVSVNPSGIIETVLRVPATTENSVYYNKTHSTNRLIGDTEYLLRNDIGFLGWVASSYSRLVMKDASGAETIIYDVNAEQLARAIMIFIGLMILITIVVFGLKKEFRKLKKDNKK